MIKPSKHFSIEDSVLVKTTIIIEILVKNPYIKFQELFYKYKGKAESDFKTFIFCLNILYSLGKIIYYKNNDTIGLVSDEIK
ncbi:MULTISPECIES: ABC-three component system middle component 6 [Bacillus]|nr:hypothetical protein BK753_20155 [Bacillus thuringiensis serovar canadensis]